jgi:serine/threonine-protein kinase
MKTTTASDLSSGITLGKWTLVKRIGRGGNGQVWRAHDEKGSTVALKILIKTKSIAYQRFLDEIKVMQTCGVKNVVPVLDSYLPDWPTGDRSWYAMPEGVPLMDYVEEMNIAEVVEQFVHIANALVELHDQKITHRDIKPANIIVIDRRACLGDFGLVDYPEKTDLTGLREELGPRWTMAPEISRTENVEDARPADVYSLAKSLWIAITGRREGFDGRYDGSKTISIQPFASDAFVGPLETLLSAASEHEPAARPGMLELRDGLSSWLELHTNFQKRNHQEWRHAQKKIFPIATPSRAEWCDAETIVSILNTVGPKTNLNHLFFPSGGGLDLESAVISLREPDCIELITNGLVSLLKPKSLLFESFGAGEEWDYFRLECARLNPSGVYPTSSMRKYEEVLDLGDGRYVNRAHWDDGEYDGESLTESAAPVTRYFEGAFVIFQKTSTYNNIPSTYDGRHSNMDAQEFRNHIEQMISALDAYQRKINMN